MKRTIFLVALFMLCLFGTTSKIQAQSSKVFWFVAPDLTSSHEESPIVMRLVNGNATPAHVTISQPANAANFPPITLTIPANTLYSQNLTTLLAQVENTPPNAVNNKGILISSDQYLSAYYEENGTNNPAIYALKGDNALGTKFLIPGQNVLDNAALTIKPYNSFNIVATQDNTTVTITPSHDITGHAAEIPFTITLNKGQTYAAVATQQGASFHLGGSAVTSDKPIAITVCDDSMNGKNLYGGTCYNEGGDQLVPTSLLGQSYIAVKGYLIDTNKHTNGDQVFIMATESNTNVYIGGAKVTTLANVGNIFRYNLTDSACYITADKNISVLQMTGFGCETDMAILSQLACTGSHSVTLARSTGDNYYLDVLVEAGGEGSFTIMTSSGSGATLTASDFKYVPGSSNKYMYARKQYSTSQIPAGAVVTVTNNVKKFHIGMIHGADSKGCRFGYFSDYASAILQFNPKSIAICQGQSVSLQPTLYEARIDNPTAIQYSWNVPDGAGGRINTPLSSTATAFDINNATVANTGYYVAHAYDSNGCSTSGVDTLRLTVNPTYSKSDNLSLCADLLPYVYGNKTFPAGTTSGTYAVTMKTVNGCDSIINLHLTIKQPTFSTTNISICEGKKYTFNGTEYNTTGSYPAHFINKAGCDSIATLNLTVLKNSYSTVNQSICQGSTFLYHNVPYNAAGTYTVYLTNAVGCDSIVTLKISVGQSTSSTTTASICDGDSYTFNHNIYTTAGSYPVQLTNAAGCDSVATLILKVKQRTSSTTTATICQGDSYPFNGNSYSDAGSHTVHLTNSVGCDSAATLILNVKQPTYSTTTAAICDGEPYAFNGQTYTAAGTYTAHLNNAAGCDSIATLILTAKEKSSSTTTVSICRGNSYTFNGTSYTDAGTYTAHLTNKAGCDSAAVLVLKLKEPTSSTVYASICRGDKYTFNGHDFTSAGTFTYHFTNAAGCDSTANLVLTIKEPTSSTTNVSICEGSSYTFNGTPYHATGQYTAHLVNKAGCDSAAILNLTVLKTYNTTINAKICEGESYTFNGSSLTNAGIYTVHLPSKNGCDSIINLNLTVVAPTSSTRSISICQNTSYTFNGVEYSASGTYTAHLTNKAGCDSTATLILTVKPTSSSVTNANICQGNYYLFNGQKYTAAGTYTYRLTNKAGCDSIATLNLTVNQPSSSTTDIAICQGESYTFNGTSYNTTGTYTATLKNAAGCDSTATLNLTVNLPTASAINESICQGDSYTFNGTSYNTTGTYTATLKNAAGCDSTATLNLTVIKATASTTTATIYKGQSYTFNGKTYTAAGTYVVHLTSAAGCDSTATLTLSTKELGSSTTTASICHGDSYSFNGHTYSTAGTYTVVIKNAENVDSTTTLELTVLEPTFSSTSVSVCRGSSYTFNGKTYSAEGTYTAHLTNVAGCDSSAVLVLSFKEPTSSVTRASICPGQSYTFNHLSHTAPGTYTYHFTNAVGCDSAAILILSAKIPTSSTTNATICKGSSYSFNGNSYNSSGQYFAHLTNKAGCDSTAILNLTVRDTYKMTINATICSGESYTFCGSSLKDAGTYIANLYSQFGCDSTVILNLKVGITTYSYTYASIIIGNSYPFNGTQYNTTGTYTATLKNAAGCDSIATLILTVKSINASVTKASICQGDTYLFNGTNYNSTGIYTAYLKNVNGYDSTAILELTVKKPTLSTSNVAICQGASYTFNGITHNATGTYTAHLTNAAGCDSTAILNLTVSGTYTTIVNRIICRGESYPFNGMALTATGTYTAHLRSRQGCDSIATLVLTVADPSSSTTKITINKGTSYTFNGLPYSTTGTYTVHLPNVAGCDSTATLILTVIPVSSSVTNAHICQGDIYWFNGQKYMTAGTYAYHLRNAAGYDSTAVLNLTVNKPTTSATDATICQGESYLFNGYHYNTGGTYVVHLRNKAGCDSTAILRLNMISLSYSTTNVSICKGESYTFNGNVYQSAGTYVVHLTSSQGCDSAAVLVLKLKNATSSVKQATICRGDKYTFNGHDYTETGTYAFHFQNTAGCDSTATLQLTVTESTISTTTAVICRGTNYIFNNVSYTTAGTYAAHLTNKAGCDSTAILILRVKEPSVFTTYASICLGETYRFNGNTYSTSGVYTKHYTNAVGCDSSSTLVLTVKQPTYSTTKASVCRGTGYSFCGKMYYNTGTYTVRLVNKAGCDSIATLSLTLKEPTASTTWTSICKGDAFTFNGKSYTADGTYSAHFTNKAGCDSTATLILNILPTSATAVSGTICYGDKYVFFGKTYTTSGSYSAHLKNSVGCDSTITLHLNVLQPASSTIYANICLGETFTFNGQEYSTDGRYSATYKSVTGCDSTSTLVLTVHPNYYRTQTINCLQGDTYKINGHEYGVSGTYTDHLQTRAGCDSTVVTTVIVTPIPNTFSPNSDGINDRFMEGWHVKVYNRNGLMLFDGTNGWDGKYNGRLVNQDTYFYVLLYNHEEKKRSREGYIVVVR